MGGASSIAYKSPSDIDINERMRVLDLGPGEQPSLELVAKKINSGDIKKIVVLCGAGISVSCGIPDFRSEGTGLYHNLQKYDLDTPESIFDIEFFKNNPRPFIHLAKELFPGKFQPSVTHHFLKLLENKNKLLRVYTQNIDGLEFQAGLSEGKVVQCHGGFQNSHCINPNCGESCDNSRLKSDILAGKETRCVMCSSLCKPAITFFGEALPTRYHDSKAIDFARDELQCCYRDCKDQTKVHTDGSRLFYCEWHCNNDSDKPIPSVRENTSHENATATGGLSDSKFDSDDQEGTKETDEQPIKVACECDLLIVMGTSLKVAPVAGLPDEVHWLCPRVLINNEEVHLHGEPKPEWPPQFGPDNGFRFDQDDNYRDVKRIGDCDEGSRQLAVMLGWENELDELVEASKSTFKEAKS
jgi:NAD-dependent SIR2 family protein deacetylase